MLRPAISLGASSHTTPRADEPFEPGVSGFLSWVNDDLPRVSIDPTLRSRKYPDWIVARRADADRGVVVGDVVYAVQPYDDEPDYVGYATARKVDEQRHLIYLEVRWETFADSFPRTPSPSSPPLYEVGTTEQSMAPVLAYA